MPRDSIPPDHGPDLSVLVRPDAVASQVDGFFLHGLFFEKIASEIRRENDQRCGDTIARMRLYALFDNKPGDKRAIFPAVDRQPTIWQRNRNSLVGHLF